MILKPLATELGPCPHGLTANKAASIREYESWRRRFWWALFSEGIFPPPHFPPAERGFEHDALCPLHGLQVEREVLIGGIKGRLSRFA